MAKHSTGVILYDELATLDLSWLFKKGRIIPGAEVTDVLTWKRSGEVTGSAKLTTLYTTRERWVKLNYFIDGQPRETMIIIETLPSNLGRGVVPYFICPITFKRCRKLYVVRGRFVHRSGLKGMYEKQTYSKRMRAIDALYREDFVLEHYYKTIRSRYFHKQIKGQPTKAMDRLNKQVKRAEFICNRSLSFSALIG